MKSTGGQKSSGSFYLEVARRANLDKNYCRFTMFVRLAPGYISQFRDQQRTWCFRGDKYTDDEAKMLKNLLNLLKNKIQLYDRIELYDHDRTIEKKIILKITDGVVSINDLKDYKGKLHNYALPVFLK
jgi:hypothetical protein